MSREFQYDDGGVDYKNGKGYEFWKVDPLHQNFGLDKNGNGILALNERHAVAASVIEGEKYYITHHAFDRFMERAGNRTKELFFGLEIKANVHNAIYALHTLVVEGEKRVAQSLNRKGPQYTIISHHWCFVLDSSRGKRIVTCYPEEKESEMSSDKEDSNYTKGWKKATREKAKEDGFYDGRFAPKTYRDQQHEEDKYLCRQKIDPLDLPLEDIYAEIEKDDKVANSDSQKEEETVKVYNDGVTFSPFKDLLKD